MPGTADTHFLALQEALAGRYSLERELGRGGMGIVYLAHEVALDRPVALKLLPPQLAALPALRERFLREARTAARLSHPHIVPIYAVDQVRDFVFFAMAYVNGETLGQRVRGRGPLPASDGARILREVAWALAYAHAQGIIHRDIKPDNILLETASGRALVSDFGIAAVKAAVGDAGDAGDAGGAGAGDEGDGGITVGVIGTPEFMSPEQASGEPVDGRSDLYALGCVAYYALSARVPFDGPTVPAILAKHITQPHAPLASAAPEVPARLARAVDRCLAKEPDQRFPNGEALAEALTEGQVARRELPIPLRVFVKRTREAYHSTGAVLFLGVIFLPWMASAAFTGAWGSLLMGGTFAAALLSAPFVSIAHEVRKLVKAGYGLEDLRLAVRDDVAQRQEELRFEFGRSANLLIRIARPVMWTALAGVGAAAAATTLVPPPAVFGIWSVFGVSLTAFAVSGVVVARHDERRTDIWGKRSLKLWGGKFGAWLYRLIARTVRRKSVAASATHRPTELAIGMAADRLFQDLPKAVRAQLPDFAVTVQRLEADAQVMRARVDELNALLAEAGDERTPHAADRRATLRARLEEERGRAGDRLREAVTALETLRLNLLRMHAGMGTVESITTELEAAREVSAAIARLAEGRKEVEKMLAG